MIIIRQLIAFMKKKQIAITIRSFDRNSEYFQKLQDLFEISYINPTGYRLEKSDLVQAIKNSEGVIAGTELFEREVLDSPPIAESNIPCGCRN